MWKWYPGGRPITLENSTSSEVGPKNSGEGQLLLEGKFREETKRERYTCKEEDDPCIWQFEPELHWHRGRGYC